MDMEALEIEPYVIEFDRQATIDAYARMKTPGPERCGCWDCRNWAAGRDTLVPPALRAILERLGIPLAGEIEVWELPGDRAPHMYGGFYMFVGRILEGPQDWRLGPTVDGWHLYLTMGRSFPVPAFDGLTTSELGFLVDEVGDFIEPPPDRRDASPTRPERQA